MQQPPHGWGHQQQGYGPPPSHGYAPMTHGYGQPPQPQRSSGNQAVFIVLAILGLVLMVPVGVCLFAGFIGASAARSSTSPSRSHGSQGSEGTVEAKPTARRSGPDVTVSASQLFSDYQANEVAADAKYKGKQVLVTGSVMSIDKDFADDIVIMIATSNPYMSIHAELKDGQSAQAAAMSKGQTVKVQCEGRGMIIGSPMLSNCFIK